MNRATDEPRGQILTRLAFALVVGLVVCRSLLLETIRDAGPSMPSTPTGPGVTTSLLLDWLSLIPALLVIGRRLMDRSFALRGASSHVWFIALALWAMLSTIWADDRFLAFVSSTRLLAAGALFWTSTQLVRRWSHVRVVAGVLVGLLLANVAQGLLSRYVDQPELRQFWIENKAAFFQQRNWTADSYEGQRFEQKLLAGELFGFNASPNALAALVVMFAVVTIGAAIQRLRDGDPVTAWPIALLLVSGSGTFLLANSGSKAAWAALMLGLTLLGLWAIAWRLLARQRLLAFAVAISLIGLAVVGVIGYGLTTGGLPSDSLNFRWRYWIGAWRVVLAHPTVGVGWANFGENYLPVRLPQAAEEIQDPHNFAVRVTAELGAVGLVLLLGWMLSYAWRATRPVTNELLARDDEAQFAQPLLGLAATFAATWLVNVLIAVGVTSMADNVGFLVYDGFRRLVLVALVAAGVAAVLLRVDPDRTAYEVDERPAHWLLVGLILAVGLLLLQSTIDVTLFQVGPLMLVAVVAGTTLGIGWRDAPPRRESLPLIAISIVSIGTIALLAAGVVPIGIAESKADDGTAALAMRMPDVAARRLISAYESTYPLNNVDYAARAAEAWTNAGPAYVPEAKKWLTVATQADPANPQAWFTRARIGAFWISSGMARMTPDEVLSDFARGLACNPSDAALQLEYADLLEGFGRKREAAAAIAEAMRIDDALDPAEPERLDLRKPGERDRLTGRIQSLLQDGTTTTQPQ